MYLCICKKLVQTLLYSKFLPTGYMARVELSKYNVNDIGQLISPLYKNYGKTYKYVVEIL